MKRALALVTAAVALAAAAPAQAGTVRAKPRSCTPKRTHVVERRAGVIISMREAWYACATWVGHSYNLFAPIYREQLAPSDGGCELGTNVSHIRVRGERLRYRLACSFGEGVEGDSTVRIRARLDLRTGRIRYRRLDRHRGARTAADRSEHGRVRAQARSCLPRHTKVVRRSHGVVFSEGTVLYACARSVGHSYNLYGPIYRAGYAPGYDGCELGTKVTFERIRRTAVRYLIRCDYSLDEGSATIRWRSRANLRSGLIRYRRVH